MSRLCSFLFLSWIVAICSFRTLWLRKSAFIRSETPRTSFYRTAGQCTPQIYSGLKVSPDADVEEKIAVFNGPASSYDDMESGCAVDELGLTIMVGKSTVATGRGLFIAVSEEDSVTTLPKGTPICGYAKGQFTNESNGDKTVAYAFSSLDNYVVYDKKLVNLSEAIAHAMETRNDGTSVVDGHILVYNKELDQVEIKIDTESATMHYFVPDENELGPGTYGMYANDLGFRENVTMEQYFQNSLLFNKLAIVWRMQLTNDIDGMNQLKPTWPVVIVTEDITFANTEPMEIGLHYSWSYWEAYKSASTSECDTGYANTDLTVECSE